MRISDWSSDVCSSDLVPDRWRSADHARAGWLAAGICGAIPDEDERRIPALLLRARTGGLIGRQRQLDAGQKVGFRHFGAQAGQPAAQRIDTLAGGGAADLMALARALHVGKAAGRERVGQYVWTTWGALTLTKKKT